MASINKLQLLGNITASGVTSFKAFGKSLQTMNATQLLNIVTTNNQALGVEKLTRMQIYRKLVEAGVNKEVAKQTVVLFANTQQTNAQAAATVGATVATGGLRKAIRGLWATMLANPLTTLIAIATIAIPIIIKVHDWISKAAERHADAMRDFQSQNEQAVSDLNSIKSELSDVKKRLEELDKIAQNGRLTPDQEAERKDLQATNQELERQLWLKQQLAESSAQSAAQEAYDAYSTKTYGSLSGDVDSYLSTGRPTRVEYNGPEMMYDLLDAMREIEQKKKALDDDAFSDKISVEDHQRLIQGLDASYTMYQSKLAEVAGEQQEFADAMAANSAFDKERLEILAAVDAWRLYGATEQEKLHYIAQAAPKAMQSAAQELVDLAGAMDAFQDGNVDLKIRPEVEIEDGSQSFISSWEKATLGDENEYAIHLTPIISEENVLTDDELSSYFDDLVNGAVSKSDILEKDSVENGGKGLVLSVKPRIDGQTDEQFTRENDQWEAELKKQQARYRDVIRKLRDDAGIQEWINKAVEAGIASDDVSDLLFLLAQAIIQVNDAAEDGPLESYADSLKAFKGTSDSLKDYYKALQSLKDLNGADIPIDLMAELMELCPDAVGMIHSVADAQQALTDKIAEQKTAAENTYSKMILSNQEWLEKTINASSSLQKTLATYYGADLENFRKLAGTKWEIEQALVSNLASLWSKYENRTLESLENQLYYLNYQAPDPNMDQIRELQAVIDMRKALAGQLDDLITYKTSTVKSKSKSKDDALKKEIEEQKKAFSEVYNAKKHLVDMDQKLIEDFYAWLDGQDGYKKYFSDLSKYADEYRKYEKEVYDGLQKVHSNYLSDLEFEIDMLERQDGAEDKVIAKLREKQEVYRKLILETEAYLRSAGMSEAQIAKNDLVQEYTKAMYSIEDSVRDVEEKLFDSARDKINDLIDLTRDLVKQEQEDKIDALEDQKDAYADIISMKKELLQLGRREREYNDEVAEKTKNIQKLQSRIEALSLDDSREAAIKKAALQEELAELQKDLADKQYDHYVDTAEDALDKELEDFEAAQDEKIKDIRKFLNDNEALNREALNRLDDMNKELFDKLEKYALQYTQTTREELVDMWNEASRAAEKYGTMANVNSVFSSSDSSTAVQSILQQMKANGNQWATAKTDDERKKYADANIGLGNQLQELLGKPVYRDGNGVWWVGDQKLFTYHSGTANVGGQPTLKQNEVWAKLEMGEGVVTPKQRSAISQILSFFNPVDKIAKSMTAGGLSQYQFAGAGGPNITVQMPLTMYGDMTNDTMKVLKDHARQVAEVVSKTLRK